MKLGQISNSGSEIKIRMKNINDDVYMQNFEDRLEPFKTGPNFDPLVKVRFIILLICCLQH